MREIPILFSGAMVRALLDGRKTQTRRALTPQPVITGDQWHWRRYWWALDKKRPVDVLTFGSLTPCPYGQPGDRLWVRETWAPHADFPEMTNRAVYRADPGCEHDAARWRPSIHMPRAASRILLEVTGVRVKRLQQISEADARAEGGAFHDGHGIGHSGWSHETGTVFDDARSSFASLWDSLYAARGHGWDVNPWVWVVEFRQVTP